MHATRHLGFDIDLRHKMVSITAKHKRKILSFFNRVILCARKNGRIPVKDIQRMLGFQIWICTVFRVARQFLSSTCDVIRLAHPAQLRKFFFPRKHPVLTARLLFDLKFWRRFVQGSPQLSFDFVLGVLPRNECLLFSDASSLFGMAGVMIFGYNNAPVNLDGLFWQMTWRDWYRVRPLECLKPGSVHKQGKIFSRPYYL